MGDLDSSRIPNQQCVECGYVMDATTMATGDEHIPMAGDVSICLKCGHVALFTAGLEGLRELSAQEWESVKQDREKWRVIQKARAIIREKRRGGEWVK